MVSVGCPCFKRTLLWAVLCTILPSASPKCASSRVRPKPFLGDNGQNRSRHSPFAPTLHPFYEGLYCACLSSPPCQSQAGTAEQMHR